MNKEIQKSRIKKYYIDVVKKLLINEGMQNVSVRRIGELTGYSYATIYNYYKNLDDLLWYVALDFKLDIIKIFENYFKKEQYTTKDIKQLLQKYIEYYLGNPNIFKFFFFYQITEPPEIVSMKITRPSIEEIQINILENLAQQNIIEPEKVKVISSLIMNSVHGMLLMHFSKKRDTTENEIYNSTEEVVDFLLA